jgi:uncharacterized metal-binding protein YceD (DUF177 family)
MDDTFKIFLKRLRDGHEEKIHEQLAPDFLDIHEAELSFRTPVSIEGSACVADEVLVLTLSIKTEATMPCAICNCDVQVQISIPHFCYTESLSEIKRGVFDYRQALREQILVELPYRAECNEGDCPERASLAKYFRKQE